MDTETKNKFEKLESQIEKLATAIAVSFEDFDVNQKILRSEIGLQNIGVQKDLRSLRKEIELIPDKIDHIYAPTLNEITDQIRVLQRAI